MTFLETNGSCSFYTGDLVTNLIMSFSGISLVVGGVAIKSLILIGVISGPVGWAVFGKIGMTTVGISIIGTLWSIESGALERQVGAASIATNSHANIVVY